MMYPQISAMGFILNTYLIINHQIKNPIFLYELSEIGQDYMWDALSKLLHVPYIHIRHDIHEGNSENRKKLKYGLNFCDAEYDDFRAAIMPHAYNMSTWFCDYLVQIRTRTQMFIWQILIVFVR